MAKNQRNARSLGSGLASQPSGPKPFLHIITRTYKRPGFLEKNQEALLRQVDKDFVHEILIDEVGIGVAAANGLLQTVEAKGRYVYVLDDDDIITDPEFIARLKVIAAEKNPDAIVVNAFIDDVAFPLHWPPKVGQVGNINFISRADIWEKHRKDYAGKFAGDFAYIDSVMGDDPNVEFLSRAAARTMRVSKGATEEEVPPTVARPKDLGAANPNNPLKVGTVMLMTTSIAGSSYPVNGKFLVKGKTWPVTENNMNFAEDLLRGGVAVVADVAAFPALQTR